MKPGGPGLPARWAEARGFTVVATALEEAFARVDIAVVIPAYQAERWIGDTLAGIPAFVRRIVVVTDGCTDGTVTVEPAT